MVTAKSLICDDDLAEEYVRLGMEWANERSCDIQRHDKGISGRKRN